MAVAHILPTHDPAYARGVALVLLAGVFWSIAGLVVRLIDHAGEWQILFYRSLALVVALLGFLAIRTRGNVLAAVRAAGRHGALAGLFLSGGFACWIFAMTHTTIANALFVLSASTFMAALLARLVLGERVKRVTLACMAVAVAGVGLMVAEGIAIGTLAGNLFALGAAAAFAAFSVTLRAGRAADMTPAVCWAGAWATLLAVGMLATSGAGFRVSVHDAVLCALLGFVQVGMGLVLFTIGSRHVPAAELTLLSLTEVVLGPVWVWLGVGEVPTLYTVVGGTVVLGAIVTQALLSVRRRPPIGVV